jgi:hypothetical protein
VSTASSNRLRKVIRFHKDSGLLDWFEQHTKATGQSSVNAAIVWALEKYREAVESTEIPTPPVPPHPPMTPLEAPVPPP